MAAQPRSCVNSSPWSQNRYVPQEPDKEGFLTRQMKCKYSVKYYNKIKKPKTEVSWLKSKLFYSENDERLTFFPVVHSVDTRWSRAPLWLPSTWSISSFDKTSWPFPFVHKRQRLQKLSCFYHRLSLIFRWDLIFFFFAFLFNILTFYFVICSFFTKKNIEVTCVIILFYCLGYKHSMSVKQIICVAKMSLELVLFAPSDVSN